MCDLYLEEPYPADPLDEGRIVRGEVTENEIAELEKTIQDMYKERAIEEGRPLVVLQDRDFYQELKRTQEVFDAEEYYVLVDEEGFVQDMAPLVLRLLDTPEARFYAKLRLL